MEARLGRSSLLVLFGIAIGAGGVMAYNAATAPEDKEIAAAPPSAPEPPPRVPAPKQDDGPVQASEVDLAKNNIPTGFQGRIHPVLAEGANLALSAHWSPLPDNTLDMDGDEAMRKIYGNLTVAEETRSIGPELLSAFLPEKTPHVGELWAVDMERVGEVLTQLHPEVRLKLHNGGPNGGFGILRAASDTHWEIYARIHAEFEVAPQYFYTPAQFAGTLLVNRTTGSVEYFQLTLPSDNKLNVDMNAKSRLVDIQHVERMELVGGDAARRDAMQWTESLSVETVRLSLSKVFYAFQNIEWMSVAEVVAKAKENKKPMHIIMLWGVLDDQSC